MKKTIAITISVIFIVCLSGSAATAGAARRHTIEGIMLGTGIAILGAAIYNEIHDDRTPRHVYHRDQNRGYKDKPHRRDTHNRYAHNKYDRNRGHHPKFKHSNRPRGHWEIKKIWIGPVFDKKWNPGHYNRRGKWVSGSYHRFLIKEGYYQKKKIWVRH